MFIPDAALRQVPRVPPDVLERPHLLERLGSATPLVVLRAASGTGKTALLAQWAHAALAAGAGPVVWIGGDETGHNRTGFWMRVLGRLHALQLIDDLTLYREMASLADHPETIVATMRRILTGQGAGLTLLIDDVGSARRGYWDDVTGDLLGVLAALPAVRCIAAGRFSTNLTGAEARTRIGLELIEDEDLALSAPEIRALARRIIPDADPHFLHAVEQTAAQTPATSRHVALVRFALTTVQHTRHPSEMESAGDFRRLIEEATRHELRSRFSDSEAQDFLRRTVLAPRMDAVLAEQLTGRPDAQSMLESLVHAGAGQWIHDVPGADPVFQYSAHLRAAALAEYPASPQSMKQDHASISHWLAEVRGDAMGAVAHALHADDLSFATHLLLRRYPLTSDESRQLSGLLREVPRWKIHRHPLLALWFALALNKDATTQKQAVAYFVSASLLGKMTTRAEPLERAVLAGIESSVQRLLGRSRQMTERARRCLALLEQVVDDPDRDRELDSMIMTSISQSAMSLFYADQTAEALQARHLQARFADAIGQPHQRNVAAANIALLHVLDGEYRDAEQALESIVPHAWPETWRDGYRGAPEHIARAHLLISEGRCDEALAALERLAPHRETIEFWDLIASTTALAQAASGSAHRAGAEFRAYTDSKLTERTLPSAKRRLAASRELLGLATGRPPQHPEGSARRSTPVTTALAALAAHAEARPAEAVELLATADLQARTTLDRMVMAVTGVSLAQRAGTSLELLPYARAVSVVVEVSGLRWPLLLLPAPEREGMIAALREAGEEAQAVILEASCEQLPPILEIPESGHLVPQLTARERDVLLVLVETGRRSEIAQRLYVSVNTVKAQLRALYAKLGASSRDDALAKASSYGLLRTEDPNARTAGDESRTRP